MTTMVQVPPDKAVVVLRKGEVQKVVTGGSVFVNPLLDKVAYVPLDVRTLDLEIIKIEPSDKEKRGWYDIKAMTRVKVSSDAELLTRNAHRLIHMTNKEINTEALQVLEEVFRRYAKSKTMVEVSENREEAARWVIGWANDELNQRSLEVRSFKIKEIEDMRKYLEEVNPDTIDLWLWATDEDGHFIPERKQEYFNRTIERFFESR